MVKDYENLGELQKIIYDYFKEAVKNKSYKIILHDEFFDEKGYVHTTILIGGIEFPCSVNRDYICMHSTQLDFSFVEMLGNIRGFESQVVKEVKKRIKLTTEESKKIKKAFLAEKERIANDYAKKLIEGIEQDLQIKNHL